MMLRTIGRAHAIRPCRILRAALLAACMMMSSSCSDDAPIPKSRLLGIDSDGDGVRDDVAAEIASNALLNSEQKKAHMQWAAAFQTMFAADLDNEDEVRNAIYDIDEAANCFFHVYMSLFGSSADAQTAIRTDMRTLSAKINDTRDRRTFFKQFNKKKEITPQGSLTSATRTPAISIWQDTRPAAPRRPRRSRSSGSSGRADHRLRRRLTLAAARARHRGSEHG